MSKGSGRRPQAITDEQLAERWAAIFQASEASKAAQDFQQAQEATKDDNDDEQ